MFHRHKRNIHIIVITFILLLVYSSFQLFVSYKLVLRVGQQDRKIQELKEQIFKLKTYHDSENIGNIEYTSSGFNFLAIGNSITIHEAVSYWPFDDRGMAASKAEYDYVHLVSNYLRDKYDDVRSYTYNFYAWEIMHYDRAEVLPMIDKFMSDKLDLICIQLSENAANTDSLKEDLEDLIDYIKPKCPNAKIIIIDDFWDSGVKHRIKRAVAEEYNLYYIDLSSIKNNDEYKCGIGTIIYDAMGEHKFKVSHSGVSKHPGDKAFRYIADGVIDLLD